MAFIACYTLLLNFMGSSRVKAHIQAAPNVQRRQNESSRAAVI